MREDEEYAICKIDSSVHIPMNKISSHLDKLDQDTVYAIICHSGVRSPVCFYLQNQGFKVEMLTVFISGPRDRRYNENVLNIIITNTYDILILSFI